MQSHHYNELDHWRNTSQRPQPSRSLNRSPVPSSSHHSSQSITATNIENASSPSDPNLKSTFIDRNGGWLESNPIQLSPSQSSTSNPPSMPKYNDNIDSTKGDVLNAISNEDILKLTKLTNELPDISRKNNLIQKEYRRQLPNSFAENDIRSALDHTLESQSINSNDSRISDSGLAELLNQDFMKPTPSNTEYSRLTNTPSYNPSSISLETEDSQYSIQSNSNNNNNNINNINQAEKILQKSNSRLYHPLSITTIPQNNNNNYDFNNSNTIESPPLTSNSDKRRSWYKSLIKRDKKKKSKSSVNIAGLNNNDVDDENCDDYNTRAASMDSYNRYNIDDSSQLPSDIQITTSSSTPKKFLSNPMSIKKHLRIGSTHRRSTSVLANTVPHKNITNNNNNNNNSSSNKNKYINNNTINQRSERYGIEQINSKATDYNDSELHSQLHGRRHSFDNFRELNLQKETPKLSNLDTENVNKNDSNYEENKLKSQSNIIPSSTDINNDTNIFIRSHNISNNTIPNINTHIDHLSSDTNMSAIYTKATVPLITNTNEFTVSPEIMSSPHTIHTMNSSDIHFTTKLNSDENNSLNIHSPLHLQQYDHLDKDHQDTFNNNNNNTIQLNTQHQAQEISPSQQSQSNFSDKEIDDDDDDDNFQIISGPKLNQHNVPIEQQHQQQQKRLQKTPIKVLYFDYQSLPRDDKNGHPTNVKGFIKSLIDNNYGMITERRIKYNWNIDKIDSSYNDEDEDIGVDKKEEGEEEDVNHHILTEKDDKYENNNDLDDGDVETSSNDSSSLDASNVIIGDICTVLSKDFQNIKSRKREIAEIHLSQEDDVGFTKLIQLPDEVNHEKGRLLNLYVSFFGPNNDNDELSIQNDTAKNLCKIVNDKLESLDPFIDEAKTFLADRAQQYHTFIPVDDPNNNVINRRGSLVNSEHEYHTIIDGQLISTRKNSLSTNSSSGGSSIPTSDGIAINKKVSISIPEVMMTPLPTTSSSLLLQNPVKNQQDNPPPLLHSNSSSLWSNFPYKEYNAYEYRQEQLNDAVLDLQRGIDEFKRSLQDTERMVRAVQIDMNDTKVKMDTYLKDVPETHYSELKRLEVSIESILANRAKSRSMELFYLLLTFLLTCFAFLLWAVICVFKIGQTAISFPKKMIISFNEYMEERNKIVKQAGMRSVAKGVDRPRSYSSDSLNSFKYSPNEILRPSHSSSTSNFSRRPSRVVP